MAEGTVKKPNSKKEKIFFVNNIDKKYFPIYNRVINNGVADSGLAGKSFPGGGIWMRFLIEEGGYG